MCKKCKNKKCSLAGKYNAFMKGVHTCLSYKKELIEHITIDHEELMRRLKSSGYIL